VKLKEEDLPKGNDPWYCSNCCKKSENKKTKRLNYADKTTKKWGGGMACAGRDKICNIVPANHFGSIPGVPVGTWWSYRVNASSAGVHRPVVAGIHGREDEGAFSIALSGGYEDDEDNGDEFIYTGSGGRDLSGNKRVAAQSQDQILTASNLAITRNSTKFTDNCKNCTEMKICSKCEANWTKGKPVRVVRGSRKPRKGESEYLPRGKGFRYDGLYKVVDYWPEKGKSGFIVYKYRFRRDDPEPAPWSKEGKKKADELYKQTISEEKEKKEKEQKLAKGEDKEKEKEKEKEKKPKQGKIEDLFKKKTKVEKVENVESNSDEDFEISDQEEEEEKPAKKMRTEQVTPESFLTKDIKELITKDTLNKKIWNAILSNPDLKNDGAFLAKVVHEFQCIICQETVKQPITTPCFHNFCSDCFENAMTHKANECPMCRSKIDSTISMNKHLQKLIAKLFPHLL